MIDPLLRQVFIELKINHFYETGTHLGQTVSLVSGWFAELDPAFGTITGRAEGDTRDHAHPEQPVTYPVFADSGSSRYRVESIDVDPWSVKTVSRMFQSNPNIHITQSDSAEFMRTLIPRLLGTSQKNENFFYLDAHWGLKLPLREEIASITRLERYAIVVDDFFVPGRSRIVEPDGRFGFDFYRQHVLQWAYIADLFERDADRIRVYYPRNSSPDDRGWVLILAGYSADELSRLDKLPLFSLSPEDKEHVERHTVPLRVQLGFKNFFKSRVPLWILRIYLRLKG